MTYDGHRAMFEAYGRNKYHSATGVIQWMLNNAWPSLIWHLYDSYLRPSGSYYGVKKANEPVHIQYSYDDRSIVLVNSSYEPVEKLTATVRVLDFSLKPVFEKTLPVHALADQSKKVLTLPSTDDLVSEVSKTYFVQLKLEDEKGKSVSQNFYWLSTQAEVFDWDHTEYTHTPMIQDGDLRDLNRLPSVEVKVTSHLDAAAHSGEVEISNSSQSLAFAIHLKLMRNDTHEEVLPILWDENYLSLLPGETRKISVHFPTTEVANEKLSVIVDGWNVRSH